MKFNNLRNPTTIIHLFMKYNSFILAIQLKRIKDIIYNQKLNQNKK